MIDRIAPRQRPAGPPIMHQTWDRLLFLHWPVSVEQLRPLIPPSLEIDTFDGTAWIAVTPLTIRNLRPPLLPAVPGLSETLELNVRTYVHYQGEMPGVWFLSLDASNPLAVWGARLGFSLPYLRAEMRFEQKIDDLRFHSHRTHADAPPARFNAAWTLDAWLPNAPPESRDFFLIERYCLYTTRGEDLYRARIHHHPWSLRRANVRGLQSTMIESHGLPTPSDSPLAHAQGDALDIEVWMPERVAG